MVRKYWLAVAFAAGLAVGLILTWPDLVQPTTVVIPQAREIPRSPVAPGKPAAEPATPFTARDATTAGVTQAAAGGSPSEIVSSATLPPADAAAGGSSGNSEPIDVGPAFREQFEQARKHGMNTPLFDLHQSLEREVRDDTWAYAAEADIQNSLVADTSMGNFKVDHLECRATMCEVRLSARGQQQSAALSRWHEEARSQPPGSRLLPRASSSIGSDANADVLVIFTQRPKSGSKD